MRFRIGQTLSLFYAPAIGVGESRLENVFCQIDGDGCSIHIEFLS